jgi:MOSC domain-containing protein YiiM
MAKAAIASVNVGAPRTVEWRGRQVRSAIWKEPVSGRITVQGVNLTGDDQADRRVHGGADRAVYAYAAEDYDWWAATTGALAPGTFGENLTTVGIDLNASHIGDRWHVGTAVLEVAQPRTPCFKLGIRMGDDAFPGRFADAGRPGVLLRVTVAGDVGAGDGIDVEPARLPAVRIGDLADADVSEETLRMVALDARVPDGWRRWAARAVAS